MDSTIEKMIYLVAGIYMARLTYYYLLYKDVLVIETNIRKPICMNKNL
jgi:hypothetical protein